MWPMLASLSGSLISGLFSSETSASNQQAQQQMQMQTEQFNAGEAQKNREFQQQMSNTAYQRSRADMEAAGLNPMMMTSMGGASTPAGSSASVGTSTLPGKTSPLANLGSAVSSAVDQMVKVKTMDKMTDEIANLKSENYEIQARTHEALERAGVHAASAAGLRELLPAKSLEGKSAQDVLDSLPDWLRKTVNVGGYVGGKASDVVAPFVSSAGAIRRFLPSKSTTERSTVHTRDGTDSFETRWDNLMGAYQR